MLFSLLTLLAGFSTAQSLSSLCTTSHVQSSLPINSFVGLDLDPYSVTAEPVYNASAPSGTDYPAASSLNYCNVTFTYSHAGLNDTVNLWYNLPDPAQFKDRFIATGGGGEAINSGASGLLIGPIYGAASGLTDGGFGGFNQQLTNEGILLIANGTIDYERLFAFAYEGIHEMSIIGKALTSNFYYSTNTTHTSKLYSYYSGCSEGRREGWSQVQRYGSQYDGVVVGAPAFRQAYQQVNHLTSGVIETVMGYFSPPCELEKINNDTIAACDSLDGKTDGVVARTDLCKLHYDQTASIGQPYSCAASSGDGGMGMGPGGASGSTPAQNGTVTAQGVAVAKAILAGLHDDSGRQVYISYQPSADFQDAQTSYNSTSGEWYAAASGLAIPWVRHFLQQIDVDTLDLGNTSYDTLRGYILQGLQKYADTLQTVWPDLEEFRNAGGKVIHYHGESDPSVPAGSSVLYQESVRKTMYGDMSYEEGNKELSEFYRLFLVPGAGHCSPSSDQPSGPYPQSKFQSLIDWVEEGKAPETLEGTVLQGENEGTQQDICAWPLRPRWVGNGTDVGCVDDEAGRETWHPVLDSIPIPVY